MELTHILIRDRRHEARSLPALVRENTASFARAHPGLAQRIWGRDEIRELLRQRFSAEVLRAFDALRPYAYQADLARYCLLHESGGIYADVSYCLLHPLPIAAGKPVVFRDFLWSSPWDASNGLFFMPPRHAALARAIEMVCANVQRSYYGATALCPTGPALFGKALASTCEAEDLITGSAVKMEAKAVRRLCPGLSLPESPAIHCLTLGERVVAIKRKPFGAAGLRDIGVTGGNAYGEMWKRREVYAPGGADEAGPDLSRAVSPWQALGLLSVGALGVAALLASGRGDGRE
ncbi:hypothetical protein GCM10027082_26180 [Comamonas humi]